MFIGKTLQTIIVKRRILIVRIIMKIYCILSIILLVIVLDYYYAEARMGAGLSRTINKGLGGIDSYAQTFTEHCYILHKKLLFCINKKLVFILTLLSGV